MTEKEQLLQHQQFEYHNGCFLKYGKYLPERHRVIKKKTELTERKWKPEIHHRKLEIWVNEVCRKTDTSQYRNEMKWCHAMIDITFEDLAIEWHYFLFAWNIVRIRWFHEKASFCNISLYLITVITFFYKYSIAFNTPIIVMFISLKVLRFISIWFLIAVVKRKHFQLKLLLREILCNVVYIFQYQNFKSVHCKEQIMPVSKLYHQFIANIFINL